MGRLEVTAAFTLPFMKSTDSLRMNDQSVAVDDRPGR
jgi:hypothetical protein